MLAVGDQVDVPPLLNALSHQSDLLNSFFFNFNIVCTPVNLKNYYVINVEMQPLVVYIDKEGRQV